MPHLIVKDFDLTLTVKSGQLFAYEEVGKDEFIIVNGSRAFWVRQNGQALMFKGISRQGVRAFFDLDHDNRALHRRLSAHKQLRPFLERYRGLRLMRQDLRQAILTFICSSNNNQKRIKKMFDGLRERFGQELEVRIDRKSEGNGERGLRETTVTTRSCPPRRRITCNEHLDGLNFGYRCPFIVQADRMLTERFLKRLSMLPYRDARALLQTIPGVGPKVADCVLTYSIMRDGRAFPADVWVKRALETWYARAFRGKALTDKNIQAFAQRAFGDDAAYAQQYLFLAAQAISPRMTT